MADNNDVSKELAALRKEVYEARSLIIKTDNLLKTFHTELKNVSTKQDQYEKRHLIGHVGAYAVIGVVAIALAILWARSAGSSAREEADRLLAQAQAAQEQATQLEREAREAATARESASKESMAVYELLTSSDASKQAEGLTRAADIDPKNLTPFGRTVIENTERQLRENAAREAFNEGISFYRRDEIPKAMEALERFWTHASRLPESWERDNRELAAYYLGAGLNRVGRHDDATRFLRWFVETPGPRSTRAYAYLLLGDSLEKIGKRDEARAAYESGLQIDRDGQHARALRKRIADM